MELSELKLISASNIIRLRTEAGMTQAELGAKLNYSDKTISKWERGEAIPDAYVLTQLAAMFGVTVDYLLSSHDAWEAPTDGGDGESVDVSLSADAGGVHIIFRDHGHGIPEGELPHVKEKFYKGSSKNRGTGIGLSVCDEIITRHNGELKIENAEGGGCRVSITLPLTAK